MELVQPRRWAPGPNAGWQLADGEGETPDEADDAEAEPRRPWREHPALLILAVAIPVAVGLIVRWRLP